MLMKIKNKMLLALDGLIEETKKKGGVPSIILFEPQEAADFLKEIRDLKIQCRKNVRVEHKDDNAVDMRFMLQAPLTKEWLQDLIGQWYKRDFVVFYKDVKILVVKKKLPDVPVPQGPIFPVHVNGSVGYCKECGSSLHRKWGIWVDGCYNQTCGNYYKKD